MTNTPWIFANGGDNFGVGGYPANSVFTTLFTTANQVGIYPGRINGYALLLDSTFSSITKTIPAKTTFAVLFAFQIITPLVADTPVFLLLDGSTCQVGISITAAQKLKVFRFSTANTLGTSVEAFNTGIWYQVEFQVTIDNAAGAIELRLNGNPTPIIAAAGIDTQQTANSTADVVQWYTGPSTFDWAIDDIIIREADGLTATSDWMGNAHIQPLAINGAGVVSQWTPNGAAFNWQCVDENPPNANTDYVSDATIGHQDTYTKAASGLSGVTVFGVLINYIAELDIAGASTFTSIINSGGIFPGDTFAPPAGSYAGFTQQFMFDPNTGADWLIADVDAAEVGQEVAT